MTSRSTEPSDGGENADARSTVDSDASDRDATSTPHGLGPGPYVLAFASHFPSTYVDRVVLPDGKATFDARGNLIGFDNGPSRSPLLGSNVVMEASSDGFVSIGRWAGGLAGGTFDDGIHPPDMNIPTNGGLFYAIGSPCTSLPNTGSATYSLESATAAALLDGSFTPGTAMGQATADFAGVASQVGISVTLTIPGDTTYTVSTAGGADSPTLQVAYKSPNARSFFSSESLGHLGAACSDSSFDCTGQIYGFVAGPNAERIGLIATVISTGAPSARAAAAAFLFKRN